MNNPNEVLEYIKMYEDGAYTRLETVSKFISLAAHIEPETIVENLPIDWQRELCEAVAEPLWPLEDGVYIGFGMYLDKEAHQRHIAESGNIYRQGYSSLHQYYQSCVSEKDN
jgi:hypothetical protein